MNLWKLSVASFSNDLANMIACTVVFYCDIL